MTELKSEQGGKVMISQEILAVIAGKAALEVEGVTGIGSFLQGNNKTTRKQMVKGVVVSVTGQNARIAIAVAIKMGSKLHEISKEVQTRIKAAVETMTGLEVLEVNVRITSVSVERRKA